MVENRRKRGEVEKTGLYAIAFKGVMSPHFTEEETEVRSRSEI